MHSQRPGSASPRSRRVDHTTIARDATEYSEKEALDKRSNSHRGGADRGTALSRRSGLRRSRQQPRRLRLTQSDRPPGALRGSANHRLAPADAVWGRMRHRRIRTNQRVGCRPGPDVTGGRTTAMEYELARLNARSFEHLIQSLAAKYLGIGTVIFGDGPDGGLRSLIYGTDRVRHRRRPVGRLCRRASEVPAATARRARRRQLVQLGALEANCASSRTRLAERSRSSISPLPMSGSTPDQDRGSKDKALAALNEEAPYLKGNDIWDFDKLRVLLNQAPRPRNLRGLGHTRRCSHEDSGTGRSWTRRTSRGHYQELQQELFGHEYANLEQAGHNPDERIPMASVFVDLPVSVRGPQILRTRASHSSRVCWKWRTSAYPRRASGHICRAPTTKPCWRRGLAAPFSSEVPVRGKNHSRAVCVPAVPRSPDPRSTSESCRSRARVDRPSSSRLV